MAFRPNEYLISPRDVVAWVRGLRLRDLAGIAAMVVVGAAVGLWLQDPGAGLFAAGLVLALWWRVDSRWAFGAALVCLVLIPLMQLAYNQNWLFSGAALANGLAVAVWYLLAIGVVRQVMELRRVPLVATALAPSQEPVAAGVPFVPSVPAAPVSAPHIPRPSLETVRPVASARRPPARVPRPAVTPAAKPVGAARRPATVPAWRQRLSALEREAAAGAPSTRRRNLDGIGRARV